MNPLVVISSLIAAASGAPHGYQAAVVAPAAIAPAAVAPAAAVVPAAPVAYAAPHVSVPAPYTTSETIGHDQVTVHQPPAQVEKTINFGKTRFVSGHVSKVYKPAIPDFRIAVPTALKGSVAYNAPVEKLQKELHVVEERYPVEKRVQVPYDVPVIKEVEKVVPVNVHVDKPYHVPVPVPVQGETIINKVQAAPIVKHTHTHVQHTAHPVAVAQPAVVAAPHAAVTYAQPAAYGYAAHAAPAFGYAHPVVAAEVAKPAEA